jgi:hypothetical protein
MKVALAILCVGGVAFLLRVLAAFAREEKRLRSHQIRVHFSRFSPKQRGELIEMGLSDQKRNVPAGTNARATDFDNTRPRAG